MFGSYRISQGVYKFSLQEVIRKDFIIKDGSTITFNGAPLNATLDIQAGYLVTSASLNDLVPDAGNYVNQTNIKVNCLMALTGQLTSPDIKMSLELPNERDEVQALVRNYILRSCSCSEARTAACPKGAACSSLSGRKCSPPASTFRRWFPCHSWEGRG